mgnify:FL=1
MEGYCHHKIKTFSDQNQSKEYTVGIFKQGDFHDSAFFKAFAKNGCRIKTECREFEVKTIKYDTAIFQLIYFDSVKSLSASKPAEAFARNLMTVGLYPNSVADVCIVLAGEEYFDEGLLLILDVLEITDNVIFCIQSKEKKPLYHFEILERILGIPVIILNSFESSNLEWIRKYIYALAQGTYCPLGNSDCKAESSIEWGKDALMNMQILIQRAKDDSCKTRECSYERMIYGGILGKEMKELLQNLGFGPKEGNEFPWLPRALLEMNEDYLELLKERFPLMQQPEALQHIFRSRQRIVSQAREALDVQIDREKRAALERVKEKMRRSVVPNHEIQSDILIKL